MTPKDQAIDEAQRIANQLPAKQRAAAAVLSALEEAEVQQMPVATLRAMKQGRPFKVKPTGITPKGFAGFTFSESIKIHIGRKLLDRGFPKKTVQGFLDGFGKSVGACEFGFADAIELCLTRDGELLQFNGMRSMLKSKEAIAIMMSGCERFYLLHLSLVVDELLERRMAFLERRAYREPESIREERERTSTGVKSVKELLSDPTLNPKFYKPLLEKIFGRSVKLEEFQWVGHEGQMYWFLHKLSGRYFGFDHAGNYYRYDDGKYVRAEFDLEELEHSTTEKEK